MKSIKQLKTTKFIKDGVWGYMNTINGGFGGESNYYQFHPIGYDYREYLLSYKFYNDFNMDVIIYFNKQRELNHVTIYI